MAPMRRPATGAPTTEMTTINPPSGKIGLSNVFISLAVAKQQLGDMAINGSGHGKGQSK
jgi:hypothetical protein